VLQCLHVHVSAYFLAEHGGCIQALDAVVYQASFPAYLAPHFAKLTILRKKA
jgi:hypothetical protein